MRIFLTGFMGAGKTAVAVPLASRLEVAHVDLDREVERACGLEVAEIFEQRGEGAFREAESRALREVGSLEGAVVATGGGTPLDPANREWMRRHGKVIWLNTPFEVIRKRIGENDLGERPLYGDAASAARLLGERQEIYSDCDLALAVLEEESPQHIVSRIVQWLEVETS